MKPGIDAIFDLAEDVAGIESRQTSTLRQQRRVHPLGMTAIGTPTGIRPRSLAQREGEPGKIEAIRIQTSLHCQRPRGDRWLNFADRLKTFFALRSDVFARPSVSMAVLLALTVSGCGQSEVATIELSFDGSAGEVQVKITNRRDEPLLVGDHFLGFVNRAPGDLSLMVSREDGKVIPRCRSYDYFSAENVVPIRKEESLVLSTHIEAVSYTHCLDSPGTYALRARLGPTEGDGLDGMVSSNVVKFAVTPEDIRRRTVSERPKGN